MVKQKSILEIFGSNLRKVRTEKGLSQRALSALCNIANGDISKMENGMVNVTLNTVVHLADTLKVPYLTLLQP